jgi:plasmid stabilization system protein ParE
MVVVYPYVLIYDYARDDNTVTLLRILHGRRDITPALVRGP